MALKTFASWTAHLTSPFFSLLDTRAANLVVDDQRSRLFMWWRSGRVQQCRV